MEQRHARGARGTGKLHGRFNKSGGSYGGSTRNFVRGLKVFNDGRECLVLGFFTSAFGRFLFGEQGRAEGGGRLVPRGPLFLLR